MFFLNLLTALFLSSSYLFTRVLGAQGQLQQVTNFGTNPNNVGMFVYRPPNVGANPALIVAIHYCTGSAQAYFSGTQYANLADQHRNFIVIYPDSPRSGKCFDVATQQTLTHNGGGDSQGIASMVQYAISNYGVDRSRVFVTGTSSGGAFPPLLGECIVVVGRFTEDFFVYSYDDECDGWRVPRLVRGCLGILGCSLRMLRRAHRLELAVLQRTAHQDRSAMGMFHISFGGD
jgi:hypothetical protein